MNKEIAIKYISKHNLIGIKAGSQRPEFLEIWMVIVDNRIFARSWGIAEKSWYNTFIKTSIGQIKCGNDIFSINALVPKDIKELTEKINQAYLSKYNTGQNIEYAQGIIRQKHIDKTMEFIIQE